MSQKKIDNQFALIHRNHIKKILFNESCHRFHEFSISFKTIMIIRHMKRYSHINSSYRSSAYVHNILFIHTLDIRVEKMMIVNLIKLQIKTNYQSIYVRFKSINQTNSLCYDDSDQLSLKVEKMCYAKSTMFSLLYSSHFRFVAIKAFSPHFIASQGFTFDI